MRSSVEEVLGSSVTFGKGEKFLVSFVGCNAPFYACHGWSPDASSVV
jgi:hypothetical protein